MHMQYFQFILTVQIAHNVIVSNNYSMWTAIASPELSTNKIADWGNMHFLQPCS